MCPIDPSFAPEITQVFIGYESFCFAITAASCAAMNFRGSAWNLSSHPGQHSRTRRLFHTSVDEMSCAPSISSGSSGFTMQWVSGYVAIC